MNRDRVRDLWCRYLAGGSLSPDEERMLLQAFQGDEELREEILQDVRAEGLLQAAIGSSTDADDFARAFFDRVAAEDDGTRFLKKVDPGIDRNRPSPGASRSRRKLTGRRLREGPLGLSWKFGVVAAAVFAAVLLALANFPTRPAGQPAKDAARHRARPVEPVDPPRSPELAGEIERKKEAAGPAHERPVAPPAPGEPRSAEARPPAEARPKKEVLPGSARTPEPPAHPPEKPREPSVPGPETVAAAAALGYVEGDVTLVAGEAKTAARSGHPILPGQGLLAGQAGSAVLVYPDGTRLTLGPGTEVREVADRAAGKPGAGKRIFLARGSLAADVAKQPFDQPMLIATPAAEAKVLGTMFRIAVDPLRGGSTRLDVDEGRVQLRRLSDQRSVVVPGGQFAVAAAGAEPTARPFASVPLPFDRHCPVIYTNNDANEYFTDEYLMALASAGDLRLRGMITTSADAKSFDGLAAGRADLVSKARRSGMRNIPDPVAGPREGLKRPDSGKIDDTQPVGSAGARLIVAEARKATPQRPLVVVSGGPLDAVADAYLLDRSIADRLVVASHSGSSENEVGTKDWGFYVVLERLRLVLLGPAGKTSSASVPRERLAALSETELRVAMLGKAEPRDDNGRGAIALLRADYCRAARRKSFDRWLPQGTLGLKDDPNGRVLVITEADGAIATAEFWRALEKAAAWGQTK